MGHGSSASTREQLTEVRRALADENVTVGMPVHHPGSLVETPTGPAMFLRMPGRSYEMTVYSPGGGVPGHVDGAPTKVLLRAQGIPAEELTAAFQALLSEGRLNGVPTRSPGWPRGWGGCATPSPSSWAGRATPEHGSPISCRRRCAYCWGSRPRKPKWRGHFRETKTLST